jgi:hypothetical protein
MIPVSWPRSWIWKANPSWHQSFFILFFTRILFFNFILQYQVYLKLGFMIFFAFLSMRLSRSHNLGRRFSRLVQVNSRFFFSCLWRLNMFSVLSFNIWLVWELDFIFFFLFFFLLGYLICIIQLVGFDKLTRVCWVFFKVLFY